MHILQINASAKAGGSVSTRVAAAITTRLRQLHPDAGPTTRDLLASPVTPLEELPTGPVDLVGNKTVYVALTSGGVHRGTVSDMPARYLTYIMGFLGIQDVRPIYAENMTRGPQAMEEGFAAAAWEIAVSVE